MDSDIWPQNPLAATALVVLVMADIHDRGPEDRDVLLEDFLRTAWPSRRSQCQ